MNEFGLELGRRLAALREQGLYRELRRVDSPQGTAIHVGDRVLLNFSSNDYLGLANHPVLKAAAQRAVAHYGVGSGAARLICGSLAPHHELEAALADFKGTEAALTFATGYAAALGTIGALLDRADVVILDKRVHACLVDAARLCGATLRLFPHQDLGRLEAILRWADARQPAAAPRRRVLIVTESVFSMDGDRAPLRELVELKDRYGAWLMVDEAHVTGLCGTAGRGLIDELGLTDRVEVQLGTLGKALGAAGGFLCGSRPLIDYLVNRARTFIFSTAPLPAAAAAATTAIALVQSAEGQTLRQRLWERVGQTRGGLSRRGWVLPPAGSAILPVLLGDPAAAIEAAARLRDRGLFVPAIRPPTVPRGQARLRVTLSATHTAADVERLVDALAGVAGCRPGREAPGA
jgi:8-amino-7-oxononanoate synthase